MKRENENYIENLDVFWSFDKSGGNLKITSGKARHSHCFFISRKDNTYPWDKYSKKIKHIYIGGTFRTLDSGMFSNLNKLESAEIDAEAAIMLPTALFENCKRLETVRICGIIDMISPTMAVGCKSLRAVNITADGESEYFSDNGIVYRKRENISPCEGSRVLYVFRHNAALAHRKNGAEPWLIPSGAIGGDDYLRIATYIDHDGSASAGISGKGKTDAEEIINCLMFLGVSASQLMSLTAYEEVIMNISPAFACCEYSDRTHCKA